MSTGVAVLTAINGWSFTLSPSRPLNLTSLCSGYATPFARCGDVRLLTRHALRAITIYSFICYIQTISHFHLCSHWTAPILPCLTGGSPVYLRSVVVLPSMTRGSSHSIFYIRRIRAHEISYSTKCSFIMHLRVHLEFITLPQTWSICEVHRRFEVCH